MNSPLRASCPVCGKPLASGAPHGLCPACLLKAGVPTGTQPPGGSRQKFVPPAPAELARDFPQLEIIELIGQGGMGAVYRARQPSLDRVVALKILPPQTASDPSFAERFTREARALARLNHPAIVAVHDFGQGGAFPYLVMEFVDGVNLRHLLAAGTMTPAEALAIVPPICDALQYAHDRGIVHRDIKPENILLGKNGVVKIADFGLAKLAGPDATNLSLTGERDVMGTPYYMAPEQVERPLEVDHRADIYSLGVVFYQMLTGELPLGRFAAPSRKVSIDVRLDEVVLRALEHAPEQRYQQATALKTEVETIATTTPRMASSDTGDLPVDLKGKLEARIGQAAIALLLVHCSNLALLSAGLFTGPLRSGYESVSQGFRAVIVYELGGLLGIFSVPAYAASLLGLYGALSMSKARRYKLALFASVVPMILPTAVWPVGFPFGIFSLWLLTRKEVADVFRKYSPNAKGPELPWGVLPTVTVALGAIASGGAIFTASIRRFFPDEPHVATDLIRGLMVLIGIFLFIGSYVACRIVAKRWLRAGILSEAKKPTWKYWLGVTVLALIVAAIVRYVALLGALSDLRPLFEAFDQSRAGSPKAFGGPLRANRTKAEPRSRNSTYSESFPPTEFDLMENNPDILREQLRVAESELALAKARFDAGLSTGGEFSEAERRVSRLRAKLAGDRIGFAQGDVPIAEKMLSEAKQRHSSGVATELDLRRAEADLQIARIRLAEEEKRVKAAGGLETANPR